MIVALLALLTAQPLPAETDIVVIGKRLAGVSVMVGRDASGRLTCGLDRSSGDASLDAQLCRAAAKCVGKGLVDHAGVAACVERRKPELLAQLERSLARGGR